MQLPSLDELGKILQAAGEKLGSYKKQHPVEGHWEGSQFKAKADLMMQDFLIERLEKLAKLPVISEENFKSSQKITDEYWWLVDPIDGTASYATGYPSYVTQAALMKGDRPLKAAVFAPELNLLYLAEKGNGATLNGKKLKTDSVQEDLCLIDNTKAPHGIAKNLADDLKVSSYVESGSLGLKICRVADRTATVFIKDVTVRDWDVAAPSLILEEAGGVITGLNSDSFTYSDPDRKIFGILAAANGLIHRQCADWYQTR